MSLEEQVMTSSGTIRRYRSQPVGQLLWRDKEFDVSNGGFRFGKNGRKVKKTAMADQRWFNLLGPGESLVINDMAYSLRFYLCVVSFISSQIYSNLI